VPTVTSFDVDAALDQAVSSRRLLTHPYYRAWEAGDLAMGDLASYAGQYRHVERCLPHVLAATAERLDDEIARGLVERNLADELTQPRPHLDLFDRFASAVGATEGVATPATAHLVGLYQEAAATGPVAALAVIAAYEVQAAEVAATKARSLRASYGLDAAGTEFWDVHAELETAHAAWTSDALRGLDASPALVMEFAGRSAEAWWEFLDDREAARLV
jgi:pyrroloquinoline-quinone synthase